jgi:hypothetical protein
MLRFSTTAATALLGAALCAQVIITESSQWTVPAGVTQVTFELVGAGGNGASNGGGGGGGGAYARGTYTVTPGTTYSIVVGAGGSELATIVGGLGILAGAGENATTVSNPNIGGGGAGGTALGGQVQRAGGNGGGGYYTYFGGGGGGAAGPTANGGIGGNTVVWTPGNCLTPGGTGGTSGGGSAGNGGKGAGFFDNNCTISDPAVSGGNAGGGGGGGNGIGSAVGIGGVGVCIITWSGSMNVGETSQGELQLMNASFHDFILLRNTTGHERYALLDATGRIIWSGMRIGEQDLSYLRAGAYVLRAEADDSTRSWKLTKL